MVRLPHSNIWVAGVVVSVLQYFNAVSPSFATVNHRKSASTVNAFLLRQGLGFHLGLCADSSTDF